MIAAVLAQSAVKDTSSAAVIAFGMLIGIALVSFLALTPIGRRSLMPVIAILLGLFISFTTLSDAAQATFSWITALGLLIGVTLVLGGFGALRDGLALPEVEGKEPEIEPRPPRITPDGPRPAESGADASDVH